MANGIRVRTKDYNNWVGGFGCSKVGTFTITEFFNCLGQNETIQKIGAAAAKASALVDANAKLAQVTLETGKVLLMGILNPQLILLKAIADEIDNFVGDFKSAGFHILEVADPENYVVPTDAEGNPIKIVMSSVGVAAKQTVAIAAGQSLEFAAWAKEFLGEEDILLTGAQKAEYDIEIIIAQMNMNISNSGIQNLKFCGPHFRSYSYLFLRLE